MVARLMGSRRRFVLGLAAAPLAARALASPAEPFPQARPITLWVPWPAGGATDLTLRTLAELAGRGLGQKMQVDNRAGAGGTLVMPILQQAAPDGYTVAQLPQTIFRAPHTQKLLWDPIRDTTPIIQISGVTFGMVVTASSAFRTLDDLFAFARQRPGELTIATNGFGTTPHVVLEELFTRRGLAYNHVPYKGTSEQMVAVSSGQVMVGVNSTGFAPFVESGQLRLLVTFAERRSKRWPGVPTLKELGHGIVAMSPYGIGGPRGLPPAIVKALHDAFRTAMQDSLFVKELAQYDQEPAYLGTEDYARACREAFAHEKTVVERMGLGKAS